MMTLVKIGDRWVNFANCQGAVIGADKLDVEAFGKVKVALFNDKPLVLSVKEWEKLVREVGPLCGLQVFDAANPPREKVVTARVPELVEKKIEDVIEKPAPAPVTESFAKAADVEAATPIAVRRTLPSAPVPQPAAPEPTAQAEPAPAVEYAPLESQPLL